MVITIRLENSWPRREPFKMPSASDSHETEFARTRSFMKPALLKEVPSWTT